MLLTLSGMTIESSLFGCLDATGGRRVRREQRGGNDARAADVLIRRDRLAEEEALVAVGVADDLDRRVLDGVL